MVSALSQQVGLVLNEQLTAVCLVNIGGSASAPIVASAYNPSYAGIGVLMGVLGAAIGNFCGLAAGYIMQLMI